MVCVAQSWVDSCGPKDATKLFAIDPMERRVLIQSGMWHWWVLEWARQQTHLCRSAVELCDGNYWRPCT